MPRSSINEVVLDMCVLACKCLVQYRYVGNESPKVQVLDNGVPVSAIPVREYCDAEDQFYTTKTWFRSKIYFVNRWVIYSL